ncbi:SGNH/GDSL hydrolase family protein [Haliangium ochraceum]|uniref:SGNH hydrolase-type esterase domain-containing protein n=1 Tax=Haliangium ochraceum (strain DSM 14365 / JCM 11303 / SMP-2) TaxID=502025 RepID=D0LJN1_HALO1|nr:GDSL-type esterase/lipase family protein [Haliangium ochraceum]ACY16605.1 conserved hypothetical protein [Haliangium ochraceum DSM 14365]
MYLSKILGALAGLAISLTMVAHADAAAHESRTLNPSDGSSSTTRRYVAFGDSIAAGYCGIFCRTSSFAVRHAQDLANVDDARVYYQGRAISGAVMRTIADETEDYANDIANADFISLSGCGNDYLDARSDYRGQSDCTNELVIAQALDTCQSHMRRALDTIAAHKKPSAQVTVMALYYPGVNTDKNRSCGSGSHFDVFLDYMVESNWLACEEALARGFDCVDGLSAFNAPDFDSNGDGRVDSDAMRYDPVVDFGNFEGYYQRVALEHKAVIGDANQKRISRTQNADYLRSDDTHPTSAGHARLGQEHSAVTF